MARKRDKVLKIWVTEEEKEIIKKKMEKVGMTNMGEFVRLCLKYQKLVKIDAEPMLDLTYEINKIGVNINQIAKKVNETNSIYQNDINEIKQKQDEIKNLIIAFYKQLKVEDL